GADTVVDDVWVCTVTPSDGEDDGTTAWDAVTITQSCDDGSVALSSSGVDFVEVCSGSFDMGCTPGQSSCDGDESPVMPVTLTRNYYLSQMEVTQGQYQALMGTNPSAYTACGTDCPVENVTWHMAAAYANELSATEGLAECYECEGSGSSVSCALAMDVYACDGYRLPTEAEWEGAARCGEDLLYPGSMTLADVAWYIDNSSGSTEPVGGKDANACGLHDMAGNAHEWTQDVYDSGYYTSAGRTDPTGAEGNVDVSLRGGSFRYLAVSMRNANRDHIVPSLSYDDIGFRLARTAAGDHDGDGALLGEDCNDSRTEGRYAGFETGDACPVAYWDMETLTSAGDIADLIGDVDLVVHGSPAAGVAGVDGTTYAMTSCSDYFLSDNGYPMALRGATEKSISAWAYLGAK
ncbi:MAG: SUMF1/EgtB/PvdO family nonheme iron enzyme, partial [Myxococcota bacterium]|nr:SUMF1/EgtB/PvdO family nonheme iron enzyme [Myxococcota bacterium]